MALLVVITGITTFARNIPGVLVVVQAVVAAGVLAGLAMGFLGFRHVSGSKLALAVAIALFCTMAASFVPVLAIKLKARWGAAVGMLAVAALGVITWALAGITAFLNRERLGATLGALVGVALLGSAALDLTTALLLVSGEWRRHSTRDVFLVIAILAMTIRLGGAIGYGVAFRRIRATLKAA